MQQLHSRISVFSDATCNSLLSSLASAESDFVDGTWTPVQFWDWIAQGKAVMAQKEQADFKAQLAQAAALAMTSPVPTPMPTPVPPPRTALKRKAADSDDEDDDADLGRGRQLLFSLWMVGCQARLLHCRRQCRRWWWPRQGCQRRGRPTCLRTGWSRTRRVWLGRRRGSCRYCINASSVLCSFGGPNHAILKRHEGALWS